MLRFKHFVQLLEAKIDDYKAQVNNISTEHDPDAEHKSASDIIDHFHKHVPGGNVQNTRWLIDRYKKGEMKQEDAPDMHDTLKDFEKYKPHLPHKNIGQYKSISDLKTAIHPHKEKDEQIKDTNNKKIVEGSTVVHDSPKVTAYHVHTTAAAQELGKNPKGEKLGWCTSRLDTNSNLFNRYNEKSNGNFHILHMHKEKFPYRRIGGVGVKGEFQDETNKLIKGKDFHDLLHRNPELHKIPAVANSKHYSIERAKDPNLHKEHMDKLVNDKDTDVRSSLAENPNLHKEHMDKLVKDESGSVRSSLAENPNLHKEHMDKLVKDESGSVRSSLAERPNLSKEHMDKLVNDENSDVRSKLAERPNLHKEHIDKLVNDKDADVRSKLAERPNLHKEHIDKLVKDRTRGVKTLIAKHPNLSKEHIDKLVKDKYYRVRSQIAERPNLHKEHIDKLVDDEDKFVRSQIAEHPNLHKEHIDKLVDDEDRNVKMSIAEHPNLHKEHMDKLVDEDKFVRSSLAEHPNLHKEHIDKLVDDEYEFVRRSIVEHPNLHKEHLDKLSKDTNKHTRTADIAKQRLESGDYKKD